jgi:hypothetical protein
VKQVLSAFRTSPPLQVAIQSVAKLPTHPNEHEGSQAAYSNRKDLSPYDFPELKLCES